MEASLTGWTRRCERQTARRPLAFGERAFDMRMDGVMIDQNSGLSRYPILMKTLPLSEVKAKLSRLIDDVNGRDEEVMITRNGVPAAVLVSADEYGSWQETLAVRADADLMRDILDGLRALKEKRSRLYTLEELFD